MTAKDPNRNRAAHKLNLQPSVEGCTHEYTIIFPQCGNTGTVTRERL